MVVLVAKIMAEVLNILGITTNEIIVLFRKVGVTIN